VVHPPSEVELYLLRHAHAGDPTKWHGPDELRPLSGKGERQAEHLARFLKSIHFTPDIVLSSPKLRSTQTAAPLAAALGLEVRLDERLSGSPGLEELEGLLLDAADPRRPVLVGHDPGFSSLVALICGAPSIPMRKGAMARIDAPRPMLPGSGTLRWLIPPDLFERAS
jgi:phosphohistidine phosphatase SixA